MRTFSSLAMIYLNEISLWAWRTAENGNDDLGAFPALVIAGEDAHLLLAHREQAALDFLT